MTLPGIGDLRAANPVDDNPVRCELCGRVLRRDWTCPVHGEVTTEEQAEFWMGDKEDA